MGWEVGGKLKREGTYIDLWSMHVDIGQKPTQYCNYPSIKKKGKKAFSKDCLRVTDSRDVTSFELLFTISQGPDFVNIDVNCRKLISYKRFPDIQEKNSPTGYGLTVLWDMKQFCI